MTWRPSPQPEHTNQEGTNVITIDTDNRCGICDHPHENHNIRYAAVAGDHTWRPAIWAGPASQTPDTVPHPDGGVTIAVDPSGGGDRLPARDVAEWIERTDPAPVEAPPEVERIDLRQVMKDLESPTTQVVAVDGGFRLVRRVGVIQRIRNATRRNT